MLYAILRRNLNFVGISFWLTTGKRKTHKLSCLCFKFENWRDVHASSLCQFPRVCLCSSVVWTLCVLQLCYCLASRSLNSPGFELVALNYRIFITFWSIFQSSHVIRNRWLDSRSRELVSKSRKRLRGHPIMTSRLRGRVVKNLLILHEVTWGF